MRSPCIAGPGEQWIGSLGFWTSVLITPKSTVCRLTVPPEYMNMALLSTLPRLQSNHWPAYSDCSSLEESQKALVSHPFLNRFTSLLSLLVLIPHHQPSAISTSH